MKKLATVALVIISFLAGAFGIDAVRHWLQGPVPVGEPTPQPQGAGWIDLLDADHIKGWKNTTDNKDIFEVKDSMIHIFGRTIYPLRYVGYAAEKFEDFNLHAEFKLGWHTNSGVFCRAQPNDALYRGFEVQVLEDYGKPPDKHSCGAIYDVVTPMFNMSRPRGEWNSFDITVNGTNVIVVMNGWKIIDTDLARMTTPLGKFKSAYAQMPRDGNILLQDHGGEAWYRNILVRPL